MNKEPNLIKISELKRDDIFSWKTYARPIWWRFIKIKDKVLYYEEIRSKYQHTSTAINGMVLKK